jgi:CRISPR-associated protein Csd1
VRQIIDSLTAPGTGETVSAGLVADVIRAALGGTRYPIGLLQRALLRARAEAGRDAWIDSVRRDARAAVVKAVLRRTCGLNVETSMDHTNIQPGYLLGRLMAVIERMQGAALGSVNATVVDRYFSGASASPSSVFPRLMKGLRHHASKAKDEEAARGTVRWLEGETDEIVSKLTGPFPAFLDLQQQGLFVIGYHHERHHLWQPRSARTNESALPSESA